MNIRAIIKATEKFVIDNSPGILTGLGVAGSVTVAILAGRSGYRIGMDASTQYHEALKDGEPLPEHLLETKHLVQTYWKEYIPAAIVLSTTIGSIVMANRIGSRRAAAIAAAFKLSEKMAEEYREKVVETLGKNNEEKVRTSLAKDRMEKTPGDIIVITGDETLFFDELSGRFFKSEMQKVRKAVNDINFQVNNDYYASLSDFYDLLGLPKTGISDELGWNASTQLEVRFGVTQLSDERPAISIEYNKEPIRGFDRCQ